MCLTLTGLKIVSLQSLVCSKCALKLDLHKAFDSIQWDFIMGALQKLNFPGKFLKWIYLCISTPSYSVKVNGSLCGFFEGRKGLRQGDPISPYLFAVAMNVLSSMLAQTPTNFKFHWKCIEMKLTHLFYADDVLLFSNGDIASLTHLMDCVSHFSNASGLSPSIGKSSAYFGNCTEEFTSWFDTTYGIAHGQLPVRFLGVPLISTMLRHNDCMPLLDKITARIGCWTSALLSLAGRVQLIKSVLYAIQAYWTNHFLLPASVHCKLQSLFTRFMWKGDVNTKGGAKISWDSICLLYAEGGLDFKHTKEWNQAQIMSHLCKIVCKNKGLWAKWVNKTVLKRKHFWVMKMPNDCSWIFRNILRLRSVARQFLSFKIGNGLGISIWFDPWWHNICLASNKHDRIIAQSGISSEDNVHSLISTGSWHLPRPFHRIHHIHPGFQHWLQNFDFPNFDLSSADVILWDGIPLHKVKARNIWNSIRSSSPQVVWHKFVWHRFRIIRYAHLEWILCHGRLPTLHRLASFGLDVLQLCHLCVGGIETDSHLFITCHYSSFILNKLAGLISFGYVGANWVEVILSLGNISNHIHRDIALLTVQTFAYHIWRERNSRLHDKGALGPNRIIQSIMVDIKAKLHNTEWFNKHANLELYRWILI